MQMEGEEVSLCCQLAAYFLCHGDVAFPRIATCHSGRTGSLHARSTSSEPFLFDRNPVVSGRHFYEFDH
jgi:hypothetical protein